MKEKMKAKGWLLCWILIAIAGLAAAAICVYNVDPFFHYHKPYTDRYFYYLSNVKQRSQNDGISKHFEYDAMITGTSLTENFRTSEMDEIFGCSSVKLPYSGSSFKEINDNLAVALKANPELRIIVRCLDTDKIIEPADHMRTDLGAYPTYLYDSDPFNDVEYLLNMEVFFQSANMLKEHIRPYGEPAGITSFDDYSNWQRLFTFGMNSVCPEGLTVQTPAETAHLTEEEKKLVIENITLNVTELADEYPYVDFYYFFSPYSILKWMEIRNEGNTEKYMEAIKLAAGLILPHENIHLFSFDMRTDIITDLNNYKDATHYAGWVNRLILKWMHDGTYRLTKDNYEEYLREEYDFFLNFDYESLKSQEDYEADYYAAALLNRELTGVDPLDLLGAGLIESTGTGGIVYVDLNEGYNYLLYRIKESPESEAPAVYVYDETGRVVGEEGKSLPPKDGEIHMHVIDFSAATGIVTVVFNGCFPEDMADSAVEVRFQDIFLY